jgi:integrase
MEPYKKEEWKRIIKSALKLSKNKEKGNFYSCMSIMLLASCGRRKDEVNTLNFDQIKDGNSTIVYRSANVKNKTPIRVPLTSVAQGVIKRLRKVDFLVKEFNQLSLDIMLFEELIGDK